MISGVHRVALVDIESTTDPLNGDRIRSVKNGKFLALKIDLVGIQTMQLGQSQGTIFSYSLEIARNLYNDEKYCWFANHLFEIKGFGKAKLEANMLLNVSKVEDSDLVKAVKQWIEVNNDLQQRANGSSL